MSNQYTLEGKVPTICKDITKWARWYEDIDNRIVAQTKIGEVDISTVFLGIDHQYGKGPPLLFKTMIFGGEHDEYQNRCSTWEEAEASHQRAIRLIKGD